MKKDNTPRLHKWLICWSDTTEGVIEADRLTIYEDTQMLRFEKGGQLLELVNGSAWLALRLRD